MNRDGPKNIVSSVQARLVDRSRELGVEHQLTLARFGGERLLYRLSKSEFADRRGGIAVSEARSDPVNNLVRK